jgi:replication factor A1
LLTTDGTWELEFMLFDERGTTLIGKTAEKLLKQYSRFDTPAEITSLVGEKITVVVKVITDKSVSKPDKDPVFDILNIKKKTWQRSYHTYFQKGTKCDFLQEHLPHILSTYHHLCLYSQKKNTRYVFI